MYVWDVRDFFQRIKKGRVKKLFFLIVCSFVFSALAGRGMGVAKTHNALMAAIKSRTVRLVLAQTPPLFSEAQLQKWLFYTKNGYSSCWNFSAALFAEFQLKRYVVLSTLTRKTQTETIGKAFGKQSNIELMKDYREILAARESALAELFSARFGWERDNADQKLIFAVEQIRAASKLPQKRS